MYHFERNKNQVNQKKSKLLLLVLSETNNYTYQRVASFQKNEIKIKVRLVVSYYCYLCQRKERKKRSDTDDGGTKGILNCFTGRNATRRGRFQVANMWKRYLTTKERDQMNFQVYHQHMNEKLHLNQHIQVEIRDCSLAIESTLTIVFHVGVDLTEIAYRTSFSIMSTVSKNSSRKSISKYITLELFTFVARTNKNTRRSDLLSHFLKAISNDFNSANQVIYYQCITLLCNRKIKKKNQ